MLLTALAVVASCYLAVALARDTNFSGAPGGGGAGPEAPPDQAVQNLCEAADRRTAEKRSLASAVIEGRLPLLQAVARFRDLNAQPPAFPWEAFRQTYPGDSDDERHGREVLQFVRQEVQQRPGADPVMVGRLEAELQGLLGHGNVRRPRPDDVHPGVGEVRHPVSVTVPPGGPGGWQACVAAQSASTAHSSTAYGSSASLSCAATGKEESGVRKDATEDRHDAGGTVGPRRQDKCLMGLDSRPHRRRHAHDCNETVRIQDVRRPERFR